MNFAMINRHLILNIFIGFLAPAYKITVSPGSLFHMGQSLRTTLYSGEGIFIVCNISLIKIRWELT